MSAPEAHPELARIDILLRLTPEHPDSVLSTLQASPEIALEQDDHGYSLLHAAASYNHVELMKTLVLEYKVDPNIMDEDGESPLFYAESLEVVTCLLRELKADATLRNEDGMTAEEKIEDEGEGEWVPAVLEFLSTYRLGEEPSMNFNRQGGDSADIGDILARPPHLPENLQINIGTMAEESNSPDPEFRRRIDELVASGNLEDEDGQRRLRELVTDAVAGIHNT